MQKVYWIVSKYTHKEVKINQIHERYEKKKAIINIQNIMQISESVVPFLVSRTTKTMIMATRISMTATPIPPTTLPITAPLLQPPPSPVGAMVVVTAMTVTGSEGA